MVLNKGYLPVGTYTSDPETNKNSDITCMNNGSDVMFEAHVTVSDNGKVSPDSYVTTILQGTFTGNNLITAVEITITDGSGQSVLSCTTYASRAQFRSFPMEYFTKEPADIVRGGLDLDSLPSGQYHGTHKALIANGQWLTVRDFEFTVE